MVSNSPMAKLSEVKAMKWKTMRRLRAEAGLSQRELAEAIGYSQASVCRFETGDKPIPERAAKLITIATYQQEERTA